MKELLEYREKLLQRLLEASVEFCEACRKTTHADEAVEGGWTVHQIAFHVRDVNREVYGARIQRTLSEDNPSFKNFDPDEWMKYQYDPSEPLENILGDFLGAVQDLHGMLKQVPVESWSRMSSHEALGQELTLQLWTERSLAHIEEHLLAVANVKIQ